MSSVPGLSSLLGGGGISMSGLGSYGTLASSIINGLNLAKTLTGRSSAIRYSPWSYICSNADESGSMSRK
jgi:hypothetical protein